MGSLTRRDFLRSTAGAAALGVAASAAPAQEAAPRRSTVVLIRDADVLDAAGDVRAEVLTRMLDGAVTELFGESDPAAAWTRVVQPDDVVGIKSNVWQFLPTPDVLNGALRARVTASGVGEGNVAVDDRGVLRNPVFLRSTALINVRPFRTHHWAGVGSCIKNYVPFSDNPPSWHDDSCANLAGLWELPLTQGKTRLNVLVMLTPLFNSKGPHDFNEDYIWPYRGLLVGSDPVAVDATGLRILEAKRRDHFGDDRPFEVPPKHIRVAEAKYGLGVADPGRIEVRKLGWAADALI